MTRLRGLHTCDSCGQFSPLGWLYQCTQDSQPNTIPTHGMLAAAPGESPERLGKRFRLLALGISPSIITQYETGRYSDDQIELIIKQKKQVEQIIMEATSARIDGTPPPQQIQASPTQSRTPSLSDKHSMAVPHRRDYAAYDTAAKASLPEVPVATATFPECCYYKCCHRCWPFLKDRVYTSFDAVWNGEEPMLTALEVAELPMLDPTILSNLEYQPAAYEPYQAYSPLDTHLEENDTDIHDFAPIPGSRATPVMATLSLSGSPSPTSPTTSYPTTAASPAGTTVSSFSSSSSLPMGLSPLKPIYPDDEDSEDEDALHMDAWHFLSRRRFSAPASPTSLSAYDQNKHWGSGDLQAIQGASQTEEAQRTGSEMGVAGGVALTEEAVETGLPDIMTQA